MSYSLQGAIISRTFWQEAANATGVFAAAPIALLLATGTLVVTRIFQRFSLVMGVRRNRVAADNYEGPYIPIHVSGRFISASGLNGWQGVPAALDSWLVVERQFFVVRPSVEERNSGLSVSQQAKFSASQSWG